MSIVERFESGRFGMEMQAASGFSQEPGGPGDAFRHIMASAYAANRHGDDIAQAMGDTGEIVGTVRNLVADGDPKFDDAEMDLVNNAAGIEFAELANGDLHLVAEKALRAIHAELGGADGAVAILSKSPQTTVDLEQQIAAVQRAIDDFNAQVGASDA